MSRSHLVSCLLQAAFLLPVLTGMMSNGLEGSQFSEVQEPAAIIVAPTRELVIQIFNEARKFSFGSMLRPVVVYGGTSVGHQLREVERGAHLVVATPGRLLDFISRGKVGSRSSPVFTQMFQLVSLLIFLNRGAILLRLQLHK